MATCRFHIQRPYIKGTTKLRDVECSIYVTFCVSRQKRFNISLDEKVKPQFWDFKNQCVKTTHKRNYDINFYLQKVAMDLQTLYSKHRETPFDKFKALAQGNRSDEKKTLFVALTEFMNQYRSEKDRKTCQKYQTMVTQLTAFDAKTPVDLPTMDFKFYDAFKRHLYAIPNPNYKKCSLVPVDSHSNDYSLVNNSDGLPVGLFDDTVYKYLVNLKTFLAWAEKRGYQVHSSYKSWEIINRRHAPISLTQAELEKLENYDFTKIEEKYCWTERNRVIKSLDVARDYLSFECRTGQRISDIRRFDYKDYSDFKWTFQPRKGNRLSTKTVTVHFKGYCASALFILQKYDYKMPVVSEQKLNEAIKKACKVAGIDSDIETFRWAQNKRIRISGKKYDFISSHTGRKTMITLSLQAGMPVEYIMELTGISNYNTLKHYRAKFEDHMIEKYLNEVENSRSAMKKAK